MVSGVSRPNTPTLPMGVSKMMWSPKTGFLVSVSTMLAARMGNSAFSALALRASIL